MKKLLFIFLLISPFANAQWTQQVSGTSNELLEIFFPATDTGFVCGGNGTILHTVNGGTNWVAQNSGTTKNLLDIFFLNTQVGFVVGDSGYFAKTMNGGTTWSGGFITNPDSIDLACVYFTDVSTGYVGGRINNNLGLILKTTNGGSSWTMSNTPTSNLNIYYNRLVFPTANTGYALTRGICAKSVDAGANWVMTDTALVNNGGMFSILEDAFFFSADTGYIVGWYNGFSGFTMNGYYWTDQLLSWNQWYAVDFPTHQVGYMVGWGQLMKTTNGGQSWWDITTSLINGGPGIFSMDFTDNTTGYACGTAGYIIKTTNGGTSGIFESAIAQNNLNVFPNPFSENTTIQLNENIEHGTVFIKDVLGKTVRETQIKNTSEILIEKKNLIPGIYFVFIVSEKGRSAAKIIIE